MQVSSGLRLILVSLFSAAALASSSCGSTTTTVINENPGAAAHDFLSASPYSTLTIEIQSVTGYAPTSTAVTNLQNFLAARLNKTTTNVVSETIASPGQTSFSIDDVRRIESANRTHFASGSNIVAYFLFLDGNSTSDTSSGSILGQAYGPSSMVMYEKTVKNNSGSIGGVSTAVLESTVLEHEFGHILGLVNTGTTPQTAHQDSAHGAHCSVTSCLMYWSVETTQGLGNILSGGGTVPALDANCIADLQANGGK